MVSDPHGSVPILVDTYGPALAAVLPERPSVVKVNADEASDTTGLVVRDATSAGAAGRVLLDRGAIGAVVTLGIDGAVVSSAAGEAHLIPPAVRGTYPVGSGDAFLAGMAVSIVGGASLIDAARMGMAAGIANALVPGAGELDRVAAQRLLPGVVVSA